MSVKLVHIACAWLTILLFIARGGWLLWQGERPRSPVIRVLPHVIDATLLACGITLAYQLQLNPLENTWLGVKLLAVVVYILLGFAALKWARTPATRLAAFLAAVGVFSYILSLAYTRQVMPWSA